MKKNLKGHNHNTSCVYFIVVIPTCGSETKKKSEGLYFLSICLFCFRRYAPVVDSRENCATLGRSSALLLGHISLCHRGDRCARSVRQQSDTLGNKLPNKQQRRQVCWSTPLKPCLRSAPNPAPHRSWLAPAG